MEPAFWQERWQRGEIGFHQPDGHDLLKKHWPALGVERGAAVFVPLAGKSLDMRWLAGQGHRVIGVELSELAVDQFFSEAGLAPTETREGAFVVKSEGSYALYCGDIFDLEKHHLAGATVAYDRAALIALPAEMRPRYADHLAKLLPDGAIVLLIAVTYPESEIEGPPFSVSREEITSLFAEAFAIESLEARDGLEFSVHLKSRGVTRLDETAYLLRRRA